MTGIEIDVRLKRFAAVGEAGEVVVLNDLEITVEEGEFLCVIGPSGCGKTTLLNLVAGLDKDFDGAIRLPAPAGQAEPVIGYVFQTPRLLPWKTVIENIDLVLSAEQIASGVVDELLTATGLEEARHVYPTRLSVGMGRRVGLVRAFATRPDLLLMDEPFVSVDEPTARRLRWLLLNMWQARPATVLFVTHNLSEAIMMADRIVLLSDAPATVIADVKIDIPRSARGDDGAIEDFRKRLVERHAGAFEGLEWSAAAATAG